MSDVEVSINEFTLRRRALRLISEGEADQVIQQYNRHLIRGYSIRSAETYHTIFVALRMTKAAGYRLSFVDEEAGKLPNYNEVALDFERDWALYFAEVNDDLPEARKRIDQVREKGGTDQQRVLGQLADGKIGLREGATDSALECIKKARGIAYELDLPVQVLRDCNWWYGVALTLEGEYSLAARLARVFLSDEPKGFRWWAYLVVGWVPVIGPRVSRFVYKRQLGL